MNLTPSDRYLRWIAILNFTKGVLLLLVAVGVLSFLHKDVEETVEGWIDATRIDSDNQYIAALLARLDLVDDAQLKKVSGLTFLYAAMFLTQGTGLLLKKRWAQYFTAIVTGSFIPIELHEVFRHFRLITLLILAINVLIFCFLLVLLRREKSPVLTYRLHPSLKSAVPRTALLCKLKTRLREFAQ